MTPRERLGELEEMVLLAVLRLAGEAYGGALRRELRSCAGRSPSVSTIYITLMRLEATVHDLGRQFGLAPEDLNLNLGPLGRLT